MRGRGGGLLVDKYYALLLQVHECAVSCVRMPQPLTLQHVSLRVTALHLPSSSTNVTFTYSTTASTLQLLASAATRKLYIILHDPPHDRQKYSAPYTCHTTVHHTVYAIIYTLFDFITFPIAPATSHTPRPIL